MRGLLQNGEEVASAGAGTELELVLDATPFYAESGGQAADTGLITGDGFRLEVLDVQAPVKGLSVHRGRVLDGEVAAGAQALGAIDLQRRLDGEKAHSGTHLVHAALRDTLALLAYAVDIDGAARTAPLAPWAAFHATLVRLDASIDDHRGARAERSACKDTLQRLQLRVRYQIQACNAHDPVRQASWTALLRG